MWASHESRSPIQKENGYPFVAVMITPYALPMPGRTTRNARSGFRPE